MGRFKYVMPDLEEMRQKMIADAEACGRVVTSFSQTATRESCRTTSVAETSEDRLQPELVTEDHSGSPVP